MTSFYTVLIALLFINISYAFECEIQATSDSLAKSIPISKSGSIAAKGITLNKHKIISWQHFTKKNRAIIQYRIINNNCISKTFTLDDNNSNQKHPKLFIYNNKVNIAYVKEFNNFRNIAIATIGINGQISNQKIITRNQKNSTVWDFSISSSLSGYALSWVDRNLDFYYYVYSQKTKTGKLSKFKHQNTTKSLTNIPKININNDMDLDLFFVGGGDVAHKWDIYHSYKLYSDKSFSLPKVLYKSKNQMSQDIVVKKLQNNSIKVSWYEQKDGKTDYPLAVFDIYSTIINHRLNSFKITRETNYEAPFWYLENYNDIYLFNVGVTFHGQLYTYTKEKKITHIFKEHLGYQLKVIGSDTDYINIVFTKYLNTNRTIYYGRVEK